MTGRNPLAPCPYNKTPAPVDCLASEREDDQRVISPTLSTSAFGGDRSVAVWPCGSQEGRSALKRSTVRHFCVIIDDRLAGTISSEKSQTLFNCRSGQSVSSVFTSLNRCSQDVGIASTNLVHLQYRLPRSHVEKLPGLMQ